MRCGDIQTGSYVGPGSPCDNSNPKYENSASVESLYNEFSDNDTPYSPVFTILPGEYGLIDAYDLPADKHIYVNRVKVLSYKFPTGDNCNPCDMRAVRNRDFVISNRERMALGEDPEAWSLFKPSVAPFINRTRTQLLIAVPGKYDLEVEDLSMIGSMQVELTKWKIELTNTLPMYYYAGVRNPISDISE